LRRLADTVQYLVDPSVGIVQYVFEQPREAGLPDFHRFVAQACDTSAFTGQKNFRNSGGASVHRDLALAKAIGEAVERYCAAIYDVGDLTLCSFLDAPVPCVNPGDFALHSPEQYAQPGFAFVPFDETTPIRWTPAEDLTTGERCYVPAAMVFVPYTYFQGSGDSPICEPISTGLACHTSYADAAISGICEVIERDAFTITWQAKLAPPQIRLETLDTFGADLVERFHRTGARVSLFDITTDVGVPTILAVKRESSPQASALTFAAAAAMNPAQAVCKSLEELCHTGRYMQRLVSELPENADALSREDIVDQLGHLSYWCRHSHAREADFLFESEKRVAFCEIECLATGSPCRDLETLVRKVRAVNCRVLIADVTTPDLRELGVTVVRAVIPGFHPLFMGYHYRALGGKRLWEVPQALGYKGINRESGDNPAPHPYP
jgi:ribosomal protein S12 methylthiotransferase accessory factor